MRRALALAAVLVLLVAGWIGVRDLRRGYRGARGTRVEGFTLHSRLAQRNLHETLVVPQGGGEGRELLVLLHGRSSSPDSNLRQPFFDELHRLGQRAPVVLLADGGDHSYWHDRRDGAWGSSVVREAIPAALHRTRADAHRVAVGGISMGGFGALDLARHWPRRFCAVGAHSAALWFRGGDTPVGAFDDAEDFARHDVLAAARSRRIYDVPVWIDVGRDDPFVQADSALARTLSAHGTHVRFHLHGGGHGGWSSRMPQYLRFYSRACA
jgi:enterochelin esterase-like enzyme